MADGTNIKKPKMNLQFIALMLQKGFSPKFMWLSNLMSQVYALSIHLQNHSSVLPASRVAQNTGSPRQLWLIQQVSFPYNQGYCRVLGTKRMFFDGCLSQPTPFTCF